MGEENSANSGREEKERNKRDNCCLWSAQKQQYKALLDLDPRGWLELSCVYVWHIRGEGGKGGENALNVVLVVHNFSICVFLVIIPFTLANDLHPLLNWSSHNHYISDAVSLRAFLLLLLACLNVCSDRNVMSLPALPLLSLPCTKITQISLYLPIKG